MKRNCLIRAAIFSVFCWENTVNPEEMEVDTTITIDPGMGGVMPISPGSQVSGEIIFNAPNANVVAGGMRFGDSGPVNVVPVQGAQGQTSGVLNLPFALSSSTCQNLATICHDIKCYEFAITADGKISRANIRDVALMCGGCDEPSCASLINPPCPPGPCSGNFNFSYGVNGSGNCACAGGLVGLVNSSWAITASNVGTSGTVSYTSDYYINSCSTCPAFQIVSTSGSPTFIAVGGSGSWSGSVYSFNATVKESNDLVNGTGPTYTVSGSINCN